MSLKDMLKDAKAGDYSLKATVQFNGREYTATAAGKIYDALPAGGNSK